MDVKQETCVKTNVRRAGSQSALIVPAFLAAGDVKAEVTGPPETVTGTGATGRVTVQVTSAGADGIALTGGATEMLINEGMEKGQMP